MKYAFIDSLRGIAILMVIVVHTAKSVPSLDEWWRICLQYGQMGVQLFFVASAYTLCLSFDRRSGELRPITNFYIRRFFRIAPIYYAGVFGYLVFRSAIASKGANELLVANDYSFLNVLANITFLHGLYPPANNNIVPGGWSIGTEVLFYVLFPLVFLLASKLIHSKAQILSLPIIVLVAVFGALSLIGPVRNNSFLYFSLLNQAPVFCFGISLYFMHKHFSDSVLSVSTTWFVLAFFGSTFLAIYVGWKSNVDGAFVLTPFISAFSFVALFEIYKRCKKLNIAILGRVGQRSYSMYLIHFVFANRVSQFLSERFLVEIFGSEISFIIVFAMTAGLSYALAGFTQVYIENYFIGIGRRVVKSISH